MGVFNFFGMKRKSRLTQNQQLDLKRTNRLRGRTGQSLLNERQYLAMINKIKMMKLPTKERYQAMYSKR